MSSCNFEWVAANLGTNPTIFDIGAANLHESVTMRRLLPNAKIFAFECNDWWFDYSSKVAQQYGISYNHCAVSDVSGKVKFYPSEILDNQVWPWSGSTCKPEAPLLTENWTWGKEREVDAITLNEFCSKNSVVPDFIHIDAQGGEYKIFKNLSSEFRPKIIWTEMTEFSRYDSGTNKNGFINLLKSFGYIEKFTDVWDSLFILDSFQTTEYQKND